MNVDYFLSKTLDDIWEMEHVSLGEISEEQLYLDIENEKIRFLFGYFHLNFNIMFVYLNQQSEKGKQKDPFGSFYVHSAESQTFYRLLTSYLNFRRALKGTENSFYIDEKYDEMLRYVYNFLNENGATSVENKYKTIKIEEYSQIFFLETTKNISSGLNSGSNLDKTSIKLHASGSYANVYKYKDPFYNCHIIIKSAKKDLSDDELKRFKKEYELMKNLSSPYIAEVYQFDDQKNEYYMEFLPYTLKKYIKGRNTTLDIKVRKSIINQLFSALRYIHSKEKFHRDLSVTNIMIKPYDDGTVIAKILDFGYFKDKDSELTRAETIFQGSLNDPNLKLKGVDKYNIQDEIYAFTQIIFFVMTGRENLSNFRNQSQKNFLEYGMNGNLNKRAESLDELQKKYISTVWN
ncbi:protein kinase family protein [Vagococcus vulneris]|uniref:Protein kinase domain-containing protein n=1 Tax=Vagococcus vulneris TaxID=1977869 RepID=A0A430A162_9ENTE|nr:protein kinase family protein [Vagococcus vulneris]RSU00107.1 hypothetical protein CBF37_02065 [Vagococcus vulneris]